MKTQHSILLLSGLTGSMVFLAGCKTVGRENIISTINTGIGATLTENPQTQLYEVKLGFIRTQFYSVPTGKNVEGTNQSNNASLTPEVVSGIRAHSGAEHLFLGMDVSESFAVGKIAVMSPAAVAMYVAQAETATAANAASQAAQAVAKAGKSTANDPPAPTPEEVDLLTQAAELRGQSPENKKKADEFIKLNGGFTSWDPFVESNPSTETLQKLIQALQ